MLASSSEEMSELARLSVPRSLVTMVPCGVDITRFSPQGPVAARGGRPRLLAPRSVADRQYLGDIMHALADVPDAELLITGGPPAGQLPEAEADGAAEAAEELARLATRLGVRHRVTFTGQVSPANLPALLRSADLLVSVAPYEPTSMAAIQAMACGTPVVAAAVGSHQDAVLDGITGVLVPPARPDLLARALRQLIAAPLRITAYGIAAADRASARYSWDRIGRETLRAYENSLRDRSRRTPGAPPSAAGGLIAGSCS